MRIAKTIGIVIGMYVAAVAADLVVASATPDYEEG